MKSVAGLCILLLPILDAGAQDWSGKFYKTGKVYPGYYVTHANDTVAGYFYHGTQTGNQKNCLYYTKEIDKKPAKEFSPEDIKSYRVGDKTYRSINYTGGQLTKPLRFLLVAKDGAITSFLFYSEDGNATAEQIFHKPYDALNFKPVTFAYFGMGFAKKFSDYIADCPVLSRKVAGKEKGYGILNIRDIIAEYNAWYSIKRK